jgi:hypothetical protein
MRNEKCNQAERDSQAKIAYKKTAHFSFLTAHFSLLISHCYLIFVPAYLLFATFNGIFVTGGMCV